MKISRLVLKLSGHNFHTKLFKEALLHKNVGGVMDLVLCTSSDGGLYLYQILLFTVQFMYLYHVWS